MIVRPFAPADFSAIVALLRETLTIPAVDEAQIARDFLLAPGFRAKHLLVAETGGHVVGYMLAPRTDAIGPPDSGWIAAFGVAPAYRRRGIGREMLRQAVSEMGAEGLTRIDVADVPVRYLVPGVDRMAFPAAFALLASEGFATRDVVASMGISLDRDFPVAPEIRPAAPGALPLVGALLADWDAGWWAHLRRSIEWRLAGDPTPSDVLCWWEDGQPLGVVHYRGGRFGPLAVSERARGRGIGAALTLAALGAMRQAGLADAYFLVARPEVQPFYTRLGFRILRAFTRMRLTL